MFELFFLIELGLVCSREPEDRLKLLNNVQCCLVFLEANNQSLLEYGGNSTLINAQHLQQKQHSDILNIAKTSKGNLDDLNEASIAIAMMRVVQSINIVYCRHIYHTIKKGKKRVFDQGVFQFKEEKVARKLMSQLKQGARRYMHLIRIFGADIVLLPLTFNPWNLEQMSEDSFMRALDSVDVEDVKKKWCDTELLTDLCRL
ncbi:hypothetical protein BDB00DRAFT_793750 [Zychaea mexicana]|uniref:uncharacterized protein n=1 Tax=Zychaea mexicana TaxID=64656 RepID=UPI0022FE1CC5|nr:uncharacterized protein BDB00DRAFT_793750 [Zychaea mexicana]KAI9468308.1 hypothetical protein BDB00DRAFT_793750 [Zychaea mexicana]